MTYVAIETLGQGGVRSAIVRANVKARARRKYEFYGFKAYIFVICFSFTPKFFRGVFCIRTSKNEM